MKLIYWIINIDKDIVSLDILLNADLRERCYE